MVEPVETALFNVFDSAHAGQWRAQRARFYQDNEEVKAATVRKARHRCLWLAWPAAPRAGCFWRAGAACLHAMCNGGGGLCHPGAECHTPFPAPPQRELIDTSFRKLRSAEGAFELLASFRSIESRGAIQAQMMSKLADILEQFEREMLSAQVRNMSLYQRNWAACCCAPSAVGSLRAARCNIEMLPPKTITGCI